MTSLREKFEELYFTELCPPCNNNARTLLFKRHPRQPERYAMPDTDNLFYGFQLFAELLPVEALESAICVLNVEGFDKEAEQLTTLITLAKEAKE